MAEARVGCYQQMLHKLLQMLMVCALRQQIVAFDNVMNVLRQQLAFMDHDAHLCATHDPSNCWMHEEILLRMKLQLTHAAM